MTRKLPPDDEVAALYAGGMPYKAIAAKFDASLTAVGCAVRRARGFAITPQTQTRATTSDVTFVRAGDAPVQHRETQQGNSGQHIELDGVYQRRSLQIHECRDLLREWGVEP